MTNESRSVYVCCEECKEERSYGDLNDMKGEFYWHEDKKPFKLHWLCRKCRNALEIDENDSRVKSYIESGLESYKKEIGKGDVRIQWWDACKLPINGFYACYMWSESEYNDTINYEKLRMKTLKISKDLSNSYLEDFKPEKREVIIG